jgi:hypothetical protein
LAKIIPFNKRVDNKQIHNVVSIIINHPKYNQVDLSDTILDKDTPSMVINNITPEFINTLNDIMYWTQGESNVDRLEIALFITELEKIKDKYEKLR